MIDAYFVLSGGVDCRCDSGFDLNLGGFDITCLWGLGPLFVFVFMRYSAIIEERISGDRRVEARRMDGEGTMKWRGGLVVSVYRPRFRFCRRTSSLDRTFCAILLR